MKADAFGADKKAPGAPAPGGTGIRAGENKIAGEGGGTVDELPYPSADTHDPNYQTLAAVAGDAFGADKKAGGGAGGGIKPGENKIAGEICPFLP